MHTASHRPLQDAPCSTVQCSGSDLLRWLGPTGADSEHAAGIVFPVRHIRASQALVHEGAPFSHLYFVRSGAFKCFQTDLDGTEQVHTFAWPGDSIGFDGICDDTYSATATAIEDSLVVVARYAEVVAAAHLDPALQRLLHLCASRELRRWRAALQATAIVGAEARVARFLLGLATRQLSAGYSGRHLRLSMSRREIASHLGLAHESVSRSLSVLERNGCVHVKRREVEILDPAGLTDVQHAARRQRNASAPNRPAPSAPAAGRWSVYQTASLDKALHAVACSH